MLVIEAKRGDEVDGKKVNLESNLNQNFEQLRHICLNYRLPFCNGVLTNFRQWYFTRYNLSREFKPVDGKKIFQVSKIYTIMKDDEVDQKKLSDVLKILEMLPCFSATAFSSEIEE